MAPLGLGLGLGLGRQGGGVSDPGELPATFTIPAGYANTGRKRINFSEPVTVTMTGGVTLSIGSTQYQSGDTIPVAAASPYFHELTINNPGADTGTITFGKRKQVTYLQLENFGSSVITGDITGMSLTVLFLSSLGLSVITGDITGMKLTYLYLSNLGSSSAIKGDITGMKLTTMYLLGIGSSLTYGTNLLDITSTYGIQLKGSTVFSASEYIQLFADAATCVAAGKWTATTKVMTISGGDNPGWGNVSEYYTTLINGGVLVKVPLAWESGDDAFPSETPNP